MSSLADLRRPSSRFIDEAGNRYGRLLVVGTARSNQFVGRRWFCRCDCGKSIIVRGPHLRNGNTVSCGCRSAECLEMRTTLGGLSDTVEYRTWEEAKRRCENRNFPQYGDYGGRGIRMCREWRSNFLLFYEALGPRPSNKHSLERINNDKGYEPGNCRWATKDVQDNNKRPRGTGVKARRARGEI